MSDRPVVDQDVLTNQTTFAEEQPIYDAEQAFQKRPVVPSRFTKNKKILIGVSTVAVVLLIAVLAAILLPRSSTQTVNRSSLQYTPAPVNNSALRQRVVELQADLEKADPVKIDLPFPPVDLELSLDAVKR